MIGTYASAALICAASLLVGRAVLGFAGNGGARTWLAPAVGFGTILTVAGFLARAPGHGTSATIGDTGDSWASAPRNLASPNVKTPPSDATNQ